MKTPEEFKQVGVKTAGKSPSQRVKLVDENGQTEGSPNYQLKKSNTERTARRLMGYDPDPSDIIGEFIASKIAKEVMQKSENFELAPEVSLVHDPQNHKLMIASRYLNDVGAKDNQYVGMSFDDLLNKINAKEGTRSGKDQHAVLTTGSSGGYNAIEMSKEYEIEIVSKGEIETVKVKIEKQELYKALKHSLMLGDHDINPGNMFIVYDTQSKESHVGRIDFGHAFNDMIKNWMVGGKHEPNVEGKKDGRGFVLDALNRSDLNGNNITKFRRDYNGIVPDLEFAKILKEDIGLDTGQRMQSAIDAARSELEVIYKSGDNVLISETNKALITLCARMGKPLEPAEVQRGDILDSTFMRISSFLEKNLQEMRSVANIIEIQGLVDAVDKGEVTSKDAANKIKELYAKDQYYLKDKSENDKVEWVRTDQDTQIFKGTVKEYIEHRGKQLGKDLSGITNELNASAQEKQVVQDNRRVASQGEDRVKEQDKSIKEQGFGDKLKTAFGKPGLNPIKLIGGIANVVATALDEAIKAVIEPTAKKAEEVSRGKLGQEVRDNTGKEVTAKDQKYIKEEEVKSLRKGKETVEKDNEVAIPKEVRATSSDIGERLNAGVKQKGSDDNKAVESPSSKEEIAKTTKEMSWREKVKGLTGQNVSKGK